MKIVIREQGAQLMDSHSKSESITSVIFNVSYIIISSTFEPKEVKNHENIRSDMNIIY